MKSLAEFTGQKKVVSQVGAKCMDICGREDLGISEKSNLVVYIRLILETLHYKTTENIRTEISPKFRFF